MAEVLLFHHALGQTPAFLAFADELRWHAHTVHTPDLYDGRTFETLAAGIAHASALGFGEIIERGVRAAGELPSGLVYAGMSLGVLPAQQLAQTRPGAAGALLLFSCVATTEFGVGWPDAVPVQIHAMESDPSFVGDGDDEAARALVASARQGELLLYPGDGHLFTEVGLPDYDPDATALLKERILLFLAER
jgi:dienelactone hydrolase